MTKGRGRDILPVSLFPNQFLFWQIYYDNVQMLKINFHTMQESLTQAKKPLPQIAKLRCPRVVDDWERVQTTQLLMAITDLGDLLSELKIAYTSAREFYREAAKKEYDKAKR